MQCALRSEGRRTAHAFHLFPFVLDPALVSGAGRSAPHSALAAGKDLRITKKTCRTRCAARLFSSMDLFFGGAQRRAQRPVEQQHEGKVAHAVHHVVGKAAQPPAQREGGRLGYKIHRCAQPAEAQAVQPAEHGPAEGMVHPAQQPGQKGQQIPDVQIHRPPQAEAIQHTLQYQKHRDGPRRLAGQFQREQDDEERHRLDVREAAHRLFAHHQKCAHQPAEDQPQHSGVHGFLTSCR